jgi:hypothetical protein
MRVGLRYLNQLKAGADCLRDAGACGFLRLIDKVAWHLYSDFARCLHGSIYRIDASIDFGPFIFPSAACNSVKR